MKIRNRFLILLLTIALVPLLLVVGLHRASMHHLGGRLAGARREALKETSNRYLLTIVEESGRALDIERTLLRLMLDNQAREVERRLAQPPPAQPRMLFSKDFDATSDPPEGVGPSGKHIRIAEDGSQTPLPVTYADQVCIIAAGTDRQAAQAGLARLSTMPDAYRALHDLSPATVYWQYTALETGVHTSYPGHGGYPEDYDPRSRPWYLMAKAAGGLVWLPPMPEVSTRTITLGLAMPVRGPDGSFAGVTGIDVPLNGILEGIRLPESWSQDASVLLVCPTRIGGAGQKLIILAQRSYRTGVVGWRAGVRHELLASPDGQKLERLIANAVSGNAGLEVMPYGGCEALWAYGPSGENKPFPIVIVPCDVIVADAAQAEHLVQKMTGDALKITGAILLGVVGVVVVIAMSRARLLTRPIRQLARASQRMAEGRYDTTVDIRTRDELQEMGEIFNDTARKLAERARMKRSLALAVEIQQHLLPHASPPIEGFDIAGRSIYCDETGGDYYDFIDLVDLGEGQTGIAVGDVSGHGIGAALLMASARAVLRSHVEHHGRDLAALFAAVNNHLVRDTGDERFVTLFYGILDAPNRSFSWTSGGHDPALLLSGSTMQITELKSAGLALGVIDGAQYGQGGPVQLGPGDVILIGTDGIWETRNADGERFGKERLRDAFAACAGETAADIHAAVVEAAARFRNGGPQEDDLTLVVIKAL